MTGQRPYVVLAEAWIRHSMEDRTEPNDHDLADAQAALTALNAAGYAVVSFADLDRLYAAPAGKGST